MGFRDISIEVACPVCDKAWLVAPKKVWSRGQRWRCPGCSNLVELPDPPRPNLPPVLYIGPEKLRRIKLTPLPPERVIYPNHGEYHSWFGGGSCDNCPFAMALPGSYGAAMDCGFSTPAEMQPYSVRSVLAQLSLQKDFPCKYFAQVHGQDQFGNTLWDEGCMESCAGCDYRPYLRPCHVAAGWMHGEETCPGWERIKTLCQSENESRFLHQYLRINHDREYPMPIPQAHVEITEQVRVDFVLFVPMTRFEWKWLAVEIDSEEYHGDVVREAGRTAIIASSGYEIVRLSAKKRMLDQVRELYHLVTGIQERSRTRA